MAVCPVIFVHGIQGSWLKDEYPVDYDDEVLWTGVLKKNFAQLHLHEADLSVDAQVRKLVRPHQAVPLIYEDLIDEIRDEMEDDGHNPYAYVFTYDWRKDNRLASAELAGFVDEVLKIAGVHERQADRRAPTQVVLIGHSMGGLVIKWCATHHLVKRKIARIITIATPYRGSIKAIEALLPGAKNLFGMENKKSMRHAARTMPGIFQLLPTYEGAVVDTQGKGLDVFQKKNWQANLISGLSRRFGPRYFQTRLNDAKAFTEEMKKPWPVGLRKRVSYAYGLGSKTWRSVAVDVQNGNLYRFDKIEADEKGDGTVHRSASFQAEIPETQKRTLQDQRHSVRDLLAGQHANMPNHQGVQDWILGLLNVSTHSSHGFESIS